MLMCNCEKNPEKRYCRIFDAYFCEKCDMWLEDKCSSLKNECIFRCSERPEKPSQIKKSCGKLSVDTKTS